MSRFRFSLKNGQTYLIQKFERSKAPADLNLCFLNSPDGYESNNMVKNLVEILFFEKKLLKGHENSKFGLN